MKRVMAVAIVVLGYANAGLAEIRLFWSTTGISEPSLIYNTSEMDFLPYFDPPTPVTSLPPGTHDLFLWGEFVQAGDLPVNTRVYCLSLMWQGEASHADSAAYFHNNTGATPYKRWEYLPGTPIEGPLLAVIARGIEFIVVPADNSDLYLPATRAFLIGAARITGAHGQAAIMSLTTEGFGCGPDGILVRYIGGAQIPPPNVIPAEVVFRSEEPGACCIITEEGQTWCVNEPPSGCDSWGGTWQGEGTSCEMVLCSEACCFSDGSCQMIRPHDCIAAGGWPNWGHSCTGSACPVGACCFSGGACCDIVADGCTSAGGAWHGAGSSCLSTLCGGPHAGGIMVWGDWRQSKLSVPTPNSGFLAVAAGGNHSLGLRADTSIAAWGYNYYGQCNIPPPNHGFTAIAAGGGYYGGHSLGLRADGSVAAWGYNNHGQCDVPTPNSDFIAIAAGKGFDGAHSLGLKADRSIVAWGYNNHGQCNVPVPNGDFVAVAAGEYHSLGLKADTSIAAWGYNGEGQCNVPPPNGDFVALAAGGRHSLGLRADGSIAAWGSNAVGECNVPAPNSDFVAVAAGDYHSIGLKTDGSLVAWGYNGQSQCDNPEPNANFVAIAGGENHSLALRRFMAGDLDDDHDVDTDDFAIFATCTAGPGVTTPPPGATAEQFANADLDDDLDVDLTDFADFQVAFTDSGD